MDVRTRARPRIDGNESRTMGRDGDTAAGKNERRGKKGKETTENRFETRRCDRAAKLPGDILDLRKGCDGRGGGGGSSNGR